HRRLRHHPTRYVLVSFNEPPANELDTLPLHDALPISTAGSASVVVSPSARPSAMSRRSRRMIFPLRVFGSSAEKITSSGRARARSEEHTSELQSRFDLVCRLLLEKKQGTIAPAIHSHA